MLANGQLLPTTYANHHPCFIKNPTLLPYSASLKVHAQLRFSPSSRGMTRPKAIPSDIHSHRTSEFDNISWDNLGFNHVPTDYMYIMKCSGDEKFSDGELQRFGTIGLNPFASILNNGQGIIEGLKAYMKEDKSILIFRPEKHGLRMTVGADRLCMPAPTIDQFVEAVKVTVSANRRWVPPPDKGFLYVRPLLLATGPVLGLNTRPPEFTFLVYVTPVRNYFEGGEEPINLVVDDEIHRGVPGGAGSISAIGNYAAIMKAKDAAKANGFYDFLYLDPDHNKYLEELSTANIFVVKDRTICTPALKGTILPGITRESIIDIARSQGFQVEERLVSVEELFVADEVFCTGNSVGLLPVGSITYLDKRMSYKGGRFSAVSQHIHYVLKNIQMGIAEDKMGWTVVLK